MKFTKIISIILLISMIATSLFGCISDGTDNSTESGETTPEETTVPETTPPPNYSEMKILSTGKVTNTELGMRVASCVNSDPYVVQVEISAASILLYGYTVGTATLELTDYFGHTASVEVEVKEGERKILTDVKKCEEEFIEVSFFGAKGSGDDTKAFQDAIDSAKPGETVYVYPGRYNVSLLVMREGITLEMYTEMENACDGYTDEIARDVNQNKYAILSGTRVLNNENGQSGSEGCSNFTIRGGVFDTNLTDRSTLIFGRAENVRLENTIYKDMKGNHTVQITGSNNFVIENCMFAGYECGSAFTREVIQIEPSTPGATGGPLTFKDGEYYCPKNVTINNCYFGESDEGGAPLMAIGHHSQVGEANATNLKITNCVFDECLYAALRSNNLVDVYIENNKFISTKKYMNATQFKETTTPAFIILYFHTGASTYRTPDGITITEATMEEQAGMHNINIKNNEFFIGAGSDKRIIHCTSTSVSMGAKYVNVKRQDKITSPVINYSGYSVNTNFAQGIYFTDNKVTIEGQPNYSDYYMRIYLAYDIVFENNTFDIASNVKFTNTASGFSNGQSIMMRTNTFTVDAKPRDQKIILKCGGKTVSILPKSECQLNFVIKNEGGTFKAETDANGNLIYNIIPDSGYTLDKITFGDSTLALDGNTVDVSSNTTFNIQFKK